MKLSDAVAIEPKWLYAAVAAAKGINGIHIGESKLQKLLPYPLRVRAWLTTALYIYAIVDVYV